MPSYITDYRHKYVDIETGEEITKQQKNEDYEIKKTTRMVAIDKNSGRNYVEVVHQCKRRPKQLLLF